VPAQSQPARGFVTGTSSCSFISPFGTARASASASVSTRPARWRTTRCRPGSTSWQGRKHERARLPALNLSNWESRVPHHLAGYPIDALLARPDALSRARSLRRCSLKEWS
jgi:hypothetical protein